jgi:hypothetical protein
LWVKKKPKRFVSFCRPFKLVVFIEKRRTRTGSAHEQLRGIKVRKLALPPLVHPEQRSSDPIILVHPISENSVSAIEVYPGGEDVETDDCILVFPADTGLNSLHLVFSKPAGGGDIKYHKPPLGLPAFPDTFPVKSRSSVQGGGGRRSRWKDRKGRIYEWDSQHGGVEMYDPQGKHLGEFDPETGEQTKPAKPGRTTPK